MPKIDMVVGVAAISMLLSGCGTLFERGGKYSSYAEYYPGVKYDWNLLTWEGSGGYDITPMLCYVSIVCPVVVLVSIPLDFVVDTVALPLDYREKREFEAYLRKKTCNAATTVDGDAPDNHSGACNAGTDR